MSQAQAQDPGERANEKPHERTPGSVFRADLMNAMASFPERFARSFMEQRRLIEALFDTSKHLAMLVNARGEIMRASRFLASTLGFEESDIRGADWRGLLVAPDGRQAAEAFMESAARLDTGHAVLPFATRYGTRLGLELVARSLREDDAPEGAGPYAFLITGSLSSDPAGPGGCGDPADEAANRVLRSMEEAVLVVEPDSGMVAGCNREAAALFGLPVESIRGRPVSSFLSPAPQSAPAQPGAERDEGPEPGIEDEQALDPARGFLNAERVLRRDSGSAFHASILAIPVIGARGSLDRVLYVIRDVSPAREAELERRRLAARLRELALGIAELGERLGGGEDDAPEPGWSFTPRQKEIAGCVLAGMPNKQIAHALGLSESSVKVHVYSMYKKTGAKSRVEFVRLLRDTGFHIS